MSDFWLGFFAGAHAMAAVVLARMLWRGKLGPKWPKWM